MTVSTQIQTTQTKILKQGALFLGQTRDAGARFAETTFEAGEQFAAETRDASASFAEETKTAGSAFAGTVGAELRAWQALFQARITDPTIGRAQLVQDRATALAVKARPETIEELILRSVQDVLKRAGLLVDERLKGLGQSKKRPKKARKGPSRKTVSKTQGKTPLRNYDKLSARDVVARIQRLSGPQVSEVLSYEKAKKARATVIRAAQQRAAVAS